MQPCCFSAQESTRYNRYIRPSSGTLLHTTDFPAKTSLNSPNADLRFRWMPKRSFRFD